MFMAFSPEILPFTRTRLYLEGGFAFNFTNPTHELLKLVFYHSEYSNTCIPLIH